MSVYYSHINEAISNVLNNEFTQSPELFNLEKNPSSIQHKTYSIQADSIKPVKEDPNEHIVDIGIKVYLSFLTPKPIDYIESLEMVFTLIKEFNSPDLHSDEIYFISDINYTSKFSDVAEYNLIGEISFNVQFNLNIEV